MRIIKEGKKLKNKSNLKNYLLFFVLVIIAYVAINNLKSVSASIKYFLNAIGPFIYGALIAYLLQFPVGKIEKLMQGKKKEKDKYKMLKRVISILIVYIIVLVLIYMAINWMIPFVYKSAVEIINNMPGYIKDAEQWFKSLPETNILSKIDYQSLFEKINKLNLSTEVSKFLSVGYIEGQIKKVFDAAGVLTSAFISIVISFNLILYKDLIGKYFRKVIDGVFNKTKASRIKRYIDKIDGIFISFLVSQGIDAVIVAVLTSIVMLILKVKFAIPLGILIGFCNLIPYVGAIVGIVVAGLVTFFSGGFTQAILMLVTVTIVQQIDANIINPKILGDNMDLNPLLIMLSLLIAGRYFGGIGVFLAAPIAAIFKTIFDEIIAENYTKRKKQKILVPAMPVGLNKEASMDLDKKYKYNKVESYKKYKEKQTFLKKKKENSRNFFSGIENIKQEVIEELENKDNVSIINVNINKKPYKTKKIASPKKETGAKKQ